MSILSIQSHVVVGHVGNAAAVFPLQVLGHEVWPIHTVLFSNHPGRGPWRGAAVPATEVAETLQGLADLGAYDTCQAVLTGYLGSAATGEVALDAWRQVRGANPDALICCDPVIGDRSEGVYVDPQIVDFYREAAIAEADVVLPNAFELEVLSGQRTDGPDQALAAARTLMERGPATVIVTSVVDEDIHGPSLAALLVTAAGAWLVSTPWLALKAKGAGDVFAALWLGHFLERGEARAALETSISSVYGLIETAVDMDGLELPVVAAREAWQHPERHFTATKLD